MKKLMLTFFLLSINLFSQLADVNIDYPDDIVTGSSFYVTIELELNASTAFGTFYADISDKGGIASMKIVNDHEFTDSEVYEPGDKITNNWGSQIKSSYWLASAWKENGTVGTTGTGNLKMKVKVVPNMSGNVYLYYRGTYINDPYEIREPDSGFYVDQQGWFCKRIKITIGTEKTSQCNNQEN